MAHTQSLHTQCNQLWMVVDAANRNNMKIISKCNLIAFAECTSYVKRVTQHIKSAA